MLFVLNTVSIVTNTILDSNPRPPASLDPEMMRAEPKLGETPPFSLVNVLTCSVNFVGYKLWVDFSVRSSFRSILVSELIKDTSDGVVGFTILFKNTNPFVLFVSHNL